jgi:CHAT domain-containing protein
MSFLPLLLALSIAVGVTVDDPGTVVRRFLLAEAGGDRDGAAALWGSPDQAFTPRQLRRMEKRCQRLAGVTIEVTSSDETQTTIETRETVAIAGRTPSAPERLETLHSRFVLKRTVAGWRIASRESLEAGLIERLKQAQETAERQQILASSPHLQTETFVRLCSDFVKQLVNQRRIDEASALARMVDDVARRIGEPVAISEISSVRSIVVRHQEPSDSDLAIQLGNEAVTHSEAADDAESLARALSRLARAKEEVDARFDLTLLERVLEVADRLEDTSSAAHAAVLLSRQREREWRRREAFRYAELASRYAEDTDDASAKITASQMLGAAYLWNADNDLARRHFERAYALSLAAGYEEVAAQSLGSLTTTVNEAEAEAMIERGLKQLRPAHAMPLLSERIRLRMQAGRTDAAESDLRTLMKLVPSNPVAARDIAMRFVLLRLAQQRYAEAAEYAAEARRLTPNSDYDIAGWEAVVLRCLGREREAIDKLEDHVAMQWSYDTSVADPRAAPFVDSMGGEEALLLELHVEQGNVRRALEVSEAVKGSSLRDALVDGGVAAGTMSDADRQQEKNLEARIHELNRALVAGTDEERSAVLYADLDDARSDLLDFRQRVLAARPFRNGGAGAERPGLEDLPSSLDEVTILSYAQTRDQWIVFLIEPKTRGERRVSMRIVPIGSEALRKKIARFISFVDQRNLRADELGEELYALLVAPNERAVLEAQRLCIIPHRALWRVPFHALLGKSGRRLIDVAPVFYAPSVAVLVEAEARRPARRPDSLPALLAFANPVVADTTASLYRAFDRNAPLGAIPETEWEVRAIAEFYDKNRTQIHIGGQAAEGIIKREAPRYDVLHIATHGLAHDHAPMFSSLLLSCENKGDEDGLLEVREIVDLDLHADTVVLSACETGKAGGDDRRRDPVIGFSWAFLAAGCRTTVVSQWKAHSAATATLMIEFHRQLANGVSKPEALREAQMVLRRDPRYRHPFYWAPFVVVGAP